MRNLFVFIMLLVSVHASSQKNPYAAAPYDSVVIYNFKGGNGTNNSIVSEKGRLANHIDKSARLTPAEAKMFIDKLGSKKSFGGGVSPCFIPHFGVVFYKGGKMQDHITICMDCNRLISSVALPAQQPGPANKEREIYSSENIGMSKSFKLYLNTLITKYQFTHGYDGW